MYFKSKLTGQLKYFDKGVKVGDFLDLTEFEQLDSAEIDKIENPERYMSDEEKEQQRLLKFRPLTRRQFKLMLHENSLLESVEQKISTIEDPILKTRIQIEYRESERFSRSNEAVQFMLSGHNLTTERLDEIWINALVN